VDPHAHPGAGNAGAALNPRLSRLRELLERRLYVVDERRTAEAILARARMRTRAGVDARPARADVGARPQTGAAANAAASTDGPQLPLTNGSIASFGLPG